MYLNAPKSSDIDKMGSDMPPDHQCYAHVDVGRAVRDFRDVKYPGTHAVVEVHGATRTLSFCDHGTADVMLGVHFHCVQLVRPKIPTANVTMKTNCVPSGWLYCKSIDGKDGKHPLVHTGYHGSVNADDTARTHFRGAQIARLQFQKSSIIDKKSCENPQIISNTRTCMWTDVSQIF